jgi:hypothetical protein
VRGVASAAGVCLLLALGVCGHARATAAPREHAVAPARDKRPPDITDANGLVYRWYPGLGYQFHPLATFGRLNAIAGAGDQAATRRLADALTARAVPASGGVRWQYGFAFAAGRPGWTSGMAQAVAAQALSRASAALDDPALLDLARKAFGTIRYGLVQRAPQGLWIKLYSFSSLAVLNAQLQSIVSLREYAQTARDAAASALADQLTASAETLLPRFDTGAWSLYSLGGAEASFHYHDFVVSLLQELEDQSPSPIWQNAAARFERYEHQPPKLVQQPSTTVAYPWPHDGYRDTVQISFSVSKLSLVTLVVAGERRTVSVPRGAGTITWAPRFLRPGTYPARLVAKDVAGNTAQVAVAPIQLRYDGDPPTLSARLVGRRVVWRIADRGTPWVRLALVFERPGRTRMIQLGRRPLAGSLRIRLPRGAWQVRLFATDSSGNRSTALLGFTGPF